MKILYGVQATGNGHITRARAMAKAFSQHGVSVDYVFSGRDKQLFFDMAPFGNWQCKRGLTFKHSNGNISISQTLKHNSLKTLVRDINALDVSPYDLVLTDFEPITAWAARRQGKRCIGIGHQYAFDHDIPKSGDNAVSRALMRYFAPCDKPLGLHWHHFGQPILPPIVEQHASHANSDNNKILVYLGFETHNDIMQLLEVFKDPLFVVYGPYSHYKSYDNIQLKPLSRQGFQNDLATCNGVICNAGFELVSEALQLGKKVLVKPLQGQMEQHSNAKAIEALNIGYTMNTLNEQTVKHWLATCEARKITYPNVADAIVKWLTTSNHQNSEALVNTLWADVNMPRQLAGHTNPIKNAGNKNTGPLQCA